MGYRGAKRFKGYSPGGGVQTSPISSSLDKRRIQKPHVGIPRAYSNSPKPKAPHHSHLPLRQKTKRTAPVIEPFVPWTPESSPPPEKHHLPDEECVATPTKKRKLESSASALRSPNVTAGPFTGLKRRLQSSDHEDLDFYARRAKVCKITDTTEDESTRRLKVACLSETIQEKRRRAHKLRTDRERMPAAAQRGMPNFTGVLCYRISLLQCLLNLPIFVNWVMDYVLPENCVSDCNGSCFACALYQLVREYWKVPAGRQNDKIKPVFQAMHSVLEKIGWTERGQADPDEQLIFFLKKLQVELPSSIFSPIESAMQSSYAQTISCQCGHKSTTYGTEAKLTVYLAPILKNGTLQRYLQRSFIDRVEYRCDSCGTTKERPKIRRFLSTGDVVCVHLSRVGPDYRKITANANIPLRLDLSKLVEDGDVGGESQVFELRSVVKHSGSANSGHYVACTVDPDSRSGGWQFFNDWSPVRKHGDEKFALGTAMGSPFLCFFQRVRKE